MRRDTQSLIDALNEVVIDEGGRIYLAKDALTRAERFKAMEPRLDDFLTVREGLGSEGSHSERIVPPAVRMVNQP